MSVPEKNLPLNNERTVMEVVERKMIDGDSICDFYNICLGASFCITAFIANANRIASTPDNYDIAHEVIRGIISDPNNPEPKFDGHKSTIRIDPTDSSRTDLQDICINEALVTRTWRGGRGEFTRPLEKIQQIISILDSRTKNQGLFYNFPNNTFIVTDQDISGYNIVELKFEDMTLPQKRLQQYVNHAMGNLATTQE